MIQVLIDIEEKSEVKRGGQMIQNDALLFYSNLDNTLPFFVESCLYI